MDIKTTILQYLVSLMMSLLTSEQLKKFADMFLDFVENSVQKSENKIDDAIVIPLLALVRLAFQIEDNDEVIASRMKIARRSGKSK